MKKLLSLLTLVALSLGFSSCCSMFGTQGPAGYLTSTRQVKTCGYEIVTETVRTGGKNGMTETVEKRVPRYKTVTTRRKVPCRSCVEYYCAKQDCCGTTSDSYLRLTTSQGPTGSPHIGLVPTMKKLAE